MLGILLWRVALDPAYKYSSQVIITAPSIRKGKGVNDKSLKKRSVICLCSRVWGAGGDPNGIRGVRGA